MSQLGANDVLSWRLAGAAVWQGAFVALAYAAAHLMSSPLRLLLPLRLALSGFSFSTWLGITTLVLLQAPAFVLHAAIMTTFEPDHAYAARFSALPAQLAALMGNIAGRCRSVTEALSQAGYLAAHVLSAALFLSFTSSTMTRSVAFHEAAWCGAWLALTHHLHTIYWGTDVLLFPSIQRHRYFRIKQRAPRAAARAIAIAGASLAAALASSALLQHRSLSTAAAGALLGPSALCALCWLMGAVTLEVVFTERLRAEDYGAADVLAEMAACLGGKRGVIMQDLALHDLSLAATDRGSAAWRRAEVFGDETGDTWRPLGERCVGNLAALATSISEALAKRAAPAPAAAEGPSAGAGGGASAAGGARWNAPPPLAAKGSASAARQQARALASVRRGYQRAVLSARFLSDLAAASLAEDRYGVLQLASPQLGDVLLCMLATLHAVQQVARQVGGSGALEALGPWRGTGDAAYARRQGDGALHALRDVLTTCIYAMTGAFGQGAARALAEAKGPPPYGSAAEAARLLQAFLQGEQ